MSIFNSVNLQLYILLLVTPFSHVILVVSGQTMHGWEETNLEHTVFLCDVACTNVETIIHTQCHAWTVNSRIYGLWTRFSLSLSLSGSFLSPPLSLSLSLS